MSSETAAHIGKILGAGHMIMGGFVTDTKGNMRLVARSVNVETSVVEYNTDVEGKQTDVMVLITKLGDQINSGLKLPPLASGTKEAAIDQAKKVPFQATMLYSRALAAKDAGNKDEAVQLLQKSLAAFPDFAPGAAGTQEAAAAERHGVAPAARVKPLVIASPGTLATLAPLLGGDGEVESRAADGFPALGSLDPSRATVVVVDRAMLQRADAAAIAGASHIAALLGAGDRGGRRAAGGVAARPPRGIHSRRRAPGARRGAAARRDAHRARARDRRTRRGRMRRSGRASCASSRRWARRSPPNAICSSCSR